MSRKPIPKDVEARVLMACRRRCPLCLYVDHDNEVKKGQIAHINKKPDDNKYDNLVWLCLNHHSEFDSTTSQHKNYTSHEVKQYRDRLNAVYEKEYPSAGGNFVLDDLRHVQALEFDGACEFATIISSEMEDLEEFCIKINFRLQDKKHGGTLMTLLDKDNNALLRLKCFEDNHDEHANELALYRYDNDFHTLLCGISLIDGWNSILISVTKKEISMSNGVSLTYAYQFSSLEGFSKIVLGSAWVRHAKPIIVQKPSSVRGPLDFFWGFVSSFSLIDKLKNKPVYNFNFEYGEQEFLSQKGSKDVIFFNMLKNWESK